jgi:predicted transcriptional regulator
MIRKQIYITEDLERRLSIVAKQQRKSEAELIREALDDKLSTPGTLTAGDALLKLADLGKELDIRLPADAGQRHDAYLYGDND